MANSSPLAEPVYREPFNHNQDRQLNTSGRCNSSSSSGYEEPPKHQDITNSTSYTLSASGWDPSWTAGSGSGSGSGSSSLSPETEARPTAPQSSHSETVNRLEKYNHHTNLQDHHDHQRPRVSSNSTMNAPEDVGLKEQLDRALKDRDRFQELYTETRSKLTKALADNSKLWTTLKNQRSLIQELRQDVNDMQLQIMDKKDKEADEAQAVLQSQKVRGRRSSTNNNNSRDNDYNDHGDAGEFQAQTPASTSAASSTTNINDNDSIASNDYINYNNSNNNGGKALRNNNQVNENHQGDTSSRDKRRRPPPPPIEVPTMKKSASDSPVTEKQIQKRMQGRVVSLQPAPRNNVCFNIAQQKSEALTTHCSQDNDKRRFRLSQAIGKSTTTTSSPSPSPSRERGLIPLRVKRNQLSSLTVDILSTLIAGVAKKTVVVLSCRERSSPGGGEGHQAEGSSLPSITSAAAPSPGSGSAVWTLEKDYAALSNLESKIRPHVGQYNVPKLPEKQLFQSSSPIKVVQRRQGLIEYFHQLLKVPILPPDVSETICFFFSPQLDSSSNEEMQQQKLYSAGNKGYLAKKKNFGGWKTKYFVLDADGPFLNYYDRPGGSLAGSISLYQGRIHKQDLPPSSTDDEEALVEYKNSYVIMEFKKKDQYTKHVLCAENERDRDSWISSCQELLNKPGYCEIPQSLSSSFKAMQSKGSKSSLTPSSSANTTMSGTGGNNDVMSSVTVLSPSSDQSLPQSQSTRGFVTVSDGGGGSSKNFWGSTRQSTLSSSTTYSDDVDSLSPIDDNNSNNENDGSKGNGAVSNKKFSFFRKSRLPPNGIPGSSSAALDGDYRSSCDDNSIERALQQLNCEDVNTESTENSLDNNDNQNHFGGGSTNGVKSVFGSSLINSLSVASSEIAGRRVPSILFRCIQLLDYRNSWFEEGIFRLSGSQTAIKGLKERFDEEHDVDLVAAGAEIHAVTGLLKLYLRQMDDNIIPKNLTPAFKSAVEISDLHEKIAKFRQLLSELHEDYYNFLHVLCGLLSKVLDNCALNKMNLHNLGIVFCPAVHIPRTIMLALLADYRSIFLDEPVEECRNRNM